VLDMNALNPGEGELQVEAMARYNMTPEPARLVVDDTRISVTFQQPLTGISPGQSVVCYRDEVVVAGGFITCVC